MVEASLTFGREKTAAMLALSWCVCHPLMPFFFYIYSLRWQRPRAKQRRRKLKPKLPWTKPPPPRTKWNARTMTWETSSNRSKTSSLVSLTVCWVYTPIRYNIMTTGVNNTAYLFIVGPVIGGIYYTTSPQSGCVTKQENKSTKEEALSICDSLTRAKLWWLQLGQSISYLILCYLILYLSTPGGQRYSGFHTSTCQGCCRWS